MAKYEWLYADTCLPDFWSGHHLPHVQIAVHHGMTPKAVKAAMRDELRQGAVMGSTDEARLLAADMVRPDEEKTADRLTRAAYAAINRMRPSEPGTRRLFLDLEKEQQDDCETVYAYFVLVEY